MVIKNHNDKDRARSDLNKQVKKIKNISLSKKVEKDKIEKEIGQLKGKIDLVLEKESKLLKYVQVDDKTIRDLKEKIKALEKDLSVSRREKDKARIENREEIKIIADSISQIRSKMHDIIKAKRYREDKIRELEDKIKNSRLKHPSP